MKTYRYSAGPPTRRDILRTAAALALFLPLSYIARSEASPPAGLPVPENAGAAADV